MEIRVNGVRLLARSVLNSLRRVPEEFQYQVQRDDPFPELHDYTFVIRVCTASRLKHQAPAPAAKWPSRSYCNSGHCYRAEIGKTAFLFLAGGRQFMICFLLRRCILTEPLSLADMVVDVEPHLQRNTWRLSSAIVRSCKGPNCANKMLCLTSGQPHEAADSLITQLGEAWQGRLHGSARIDDQQLPAPEFAAGTGIESVRRVTWRLVHGRTCYQLSLAIMSRFSRSQITLNGFIIHKKQHAIWSQVGNCRALHIHV